MADIELDNIGEEGREEERAEETKRAEEEETSFTENTRDNYDNTRSRINSGSATQSKTNEGVDENDLQNLEKRIRSLQDKSLEKRRKVIEALESATGVRFDMTHGDKSKYLISKISDAKYSEKDNRLIALKFDGKDVILTKKGEINKTATVQNRKIWKAIAAANEEYEKSADAVIDKAAGLSVSDEARESVRENVVERLRERAEEKLEEISSIDSDGDIIRALGRGIRDADVKINYDDLEDPIEKERYEGKVDGLDIEKKNWREKAEKERDPIKKVLFKLAVDFCEIKKSEMELKANQSPTSELGQNMIEEETNANDLTRFERFKKWTKENIAGVSAVAISIAGVVTAAVMTGRGALKKGAKAVGQFGKALANLAKKAGPAIATILNIIAQVLTWGAKALEFLSRNLWLVALILTYLLCDTVKYRLRNK